MIDLDSIDLFKQHYKTLKQTSKDKHDNGTPRFLTESEKRVVAFDKVKNKYIAPLRLSETPRSCDALFQTNDGYIMIEFKTGKIDQKKKYQIWQKTYDSLLIFSDIIHVNISELRNEADLILVYEEEKNLDNEDLEDQDPSTRVQESKSLRLFEKNISALAKKRIIRFGLHRFERYCFRRVDTYSIEEFNQYLSQMA